MSESLRPPLSPHSARRHWGRFPGGGEGSRRVVDQRRNNVYLEDEEFALVDTLREMSERSVLVHRQL